MEDFNRLASKYAKVLTELKEILHCLESVKEQQDEKQDEQSQSSSSEFTSQCSEEGLHETEEERNLATDTTLRPHLRNEEYGSVKQASSSKTVTGDLKHHEDGISEEGEIVSHVAASNEEHDYAEVFQAMINTDLCS